MGAVAPQVTRPTTVYPTAHPVADQRKHQSSASLALARGIHRRSMNHPHKWPATRKMFPFDDVIMHSCSCYLEQWWPILFISGAICPGGGQMARISQTTFSNSYFMIKSLMFRFKFQWSFFTKGPIDNKSVLVWVMARHRTGDMPLPEPKFTQFTNAYMRHQGGMR